MRNSLTLFSAEDDIQSHRIRFLLAAKGIHYECVVVKSHALPEDLIDLNPYASIPTLVERELVLYNANVVSEYLDERYPHPSLMPADPLSRARIRLTLLRIEQDWIPSIHALKTGTKLQADAAHKQLHALLTISAPLFRASKFFLHSELSLADCIMAPVLWRLKGLGVSLADKERTAIEEYKKRLFNNPGFKRSLTEQEKSLYANTT